MVRRPDASSQHRSERRQRTRCVVDRAQHVRAGHRLDPERGAQRPPASQGSDADRGGAEPRVQPEREAVPHQDRCQQPHQQRIDVELTRQQQRRDEACATGPGGGGAGHVDRSGALTCQRVGPVGAGCHRCGPQRQRPVDVRPALPVGLSFPQPGAPGPVRIDGVLDQQVGADQRRVVLPQRRSGRRGVSPERRADHFASVRRVPVAVERTGRSGDPSRGLVQQGGGVAARRHLRHRASGQEQHRVGVDLCCCGAHRLLDGGGGVHRVGLEGQLLRDVTVLRHDDRRSGPVGQRDARTGDLGGLVAEPDEGGDGALTLRRVILRRRSPTWSAEHHHQRRTAPHQRDPDGDADRSLAGDRSEDRHHGQGKGRACGERPGRSAEALRHTCQLSFRGQASA